MWMQQRGREMQGSGVSFWRAASSVAQCLPSAGWCSPVACQTGRKSLQRKLNRSFQKQNMFRILTWSGFEMRIHQSTAPCRRHHVWRWWSDRGEGDLACSSHDKTASPGCSVGGKQQADSHLLNCWRFPNLSSTYQPFSWNEFSFKNPMGKEHT